MGHRRSRVWRRAAVLGMLATLTVAGLDGQSSRRADADYLRAAYDTYRSMQRSSPYAALRWQYLGPINLSGRATDIAVADRGSSRRIYAGYATSGVWQTDDNGATWQPIFENFPSTSIGDLAVAPSNPDILWVGTGEANLFRASMPGVGIYKSTDGGRTFVYAGLSDTQTIARIVVHPANPDIVYVAGSGHEWTDNDNRGVFKTTDGGRNWKKVFYRGPRTGAIDLVMDPGDPNTLYAAMWQRVRRRWSDPRVEPGYDEGGIWKTTDGGNSWAEANTGLPVPQHRGRIGIDIARSNPSVLYAFVDSYEPGTSPRAGERDAYERPILEARIRAAEVYRTDDRGATWRKVSDTNAFMSGHSGTYGWVFGQIRVDPTDDKTIYTLGLGLNVSHNAGKTFVSLRGPPGDWTSAPGGEGSYHAIDPENPNIVYSHSFYGNFTRTDLRIPAPPGRRGGGNASAGRGQAAGRSGPRRSTPIRPKEDNLRAQWMAPIIVSPHKATTIYAGFQYVFRSLDRGTTWQAISADLSDNDPARMLRRSSSEIPYQTVVALAESPRKPGLLYAGTDDGRLHVTMGGGRRWSEITAALRGRKWISRVVPSQHAEGTVYVTQRGREDDDFAPYIYKSSDNGGTFTSIVNNIPAGSVNVVREDPVDPNVLYAGTDFGAFVSTDGGRRWQVLGGNLPSVQVSDLQYQSRDHVIVISTYGRGMWALDTLKIRGK